MRVKIKKFKRVVYNLTIFKLYKKYIYSKFIGFKINTVNVRGKINKTNTEFREKNGSLYIKNIKQIQDRIKENKTLGIKNILEIGFGDGEYLLSIAYKNKNSFIVGLELYTLGIILAAKKLHKNKILNANLIEMDARDFISKFQNDFDKVYILFPDPWRKTRHNKRRLIKKEFIFKLLKLLKKEGKIVIATDWQDYADEIESHIKDFNYKKVEIENIYKTAFARRAIREGRQITTFQVNN